VPKLCMHRFQRFPRRKPNSGPNSIYMLRSSSKYGSSCGLVSLGVYGNKNGAQVEDTLNNSNDLFLTFRKEMEEMSRKTKRLEKENLMLSRKSDTTNRNLLEMAEERTRHQKDYDSLKQRNAKLESICRALQKERNSLENRLRAEGEEMLEDDEGDSDYEDSDELEEGSDEGSEDDEEEVDEDTEEENLAVMAELQDLGMNGVPPVKPIIQNGNSAHVAANHA